MVTHNDKNSQSLAGRSGVRELRGQLLTLKRDLEHFAMAHSSPQLTVTIEDRIRQIEVQLADALTPTVRRAATLVEGGRPVRRARKGLPPCDSMSVTN